MDSTRKTAIIVGVLIITALASSMLSGVFLESIYEADYLTAVSASEKQVLIGVLFMVALTISVVSIPIVMFPILKNYNESLALMYVGAKIFEGFFDIVIALSELLLLTLSREYVNAVAPVASYFQTSGALLLALNEWASVVENFPYSLGALIFYYLLYRSKLIPRWLSGWGLIGATLMIATGFWRMYNPSMIFLAIPLILNELVLAGWLIVKGFNPPELNSSSTP